MVEFNQELDFRFSIESNSKLKLNEFNKILPSTNTLSRHSHYNPYTKNLLDISTKDSAYLISPTNENNECLNINYLCRYNNISINLNSPILQLKATKSNTLHRSRLVSNLLAIKCQSKVIFYNLHKNNLTEVLNWNNPQPISDLSWLDYNCLLIDNIDNVYKFSYSPRLKNPFELHHLVYQQPFNQSFDYRFRAIDFSPYDRQANNSCLTANNHQLKLVDFRVCLHFFVVSLLTINSHLTQLYYTLQMQPLPILKVF